MIYLDNSATTRQYDDVTEIMLKCMKEDFGNPSSLYSLGLDAEKTLKKAREQVTDAIGSGRTVFTSGGTEADNTAVFGAAKALKRRGRRIVTSAVEHPAVLECCSRLEEEGFEVIRVGVDSKCRPDMEQLANAVNSDTILVTFMHVNNETGTVMPIDEIRKIMDKNKSPGLLHTDAVQSFGKMRMPRNADMVSMSGHKIHGPKGVGALWIREKNSQGKKILLPAYITGGGQEQGQRSGTENVPAIAGLGKAVEIALNDREKEMKRLAGIRAEIIGELEKTLPDVILNSPREAGEKPGMCCPTVINMTFMGTRGEVLLHDLERDGIYVSTGSACSSNKKGQSHVLKAMGLKDKEIEGTIRISLGRFNSMDEVDFITEKIRAAVTRFRKLGSFR